MKKRKRPDDTKLRELILHVCRKSKNDPRFGAVKLNKLLFYADFLAYLELGQAITGHEYQKLENGPAPRKLLPILERMEDEDEITFRTGIFYGRKQRKTVALRKPKLKVFTADEIELVDRVIDNCRGRTGTAMSNMSHTFIGWELAEIGETIPYNVALLDIRKPTKEERMRGKKLESLARRCLATNVA